MAKKKNDIVNTVDFLLSCVGYLVLGLIGIGIVIGIVSIVPVAGFFGQLAVAVGVSALFGGAFVVLAAPSRAKRREENARRAEQQQEEDARKVEQEREEDARWFKQQRIKALGAKNAAFVESAQAAVQQVTASEAARAGWLGDIDFTADIRGITDSFRKTHSLRKVADALSALDKPSADDRKILAEAKATADALEVTATERVKLIEKCATEAKLVDESLKKERKDARTAEQRAELHAELSGMLYGIEANPAETRTNSGADAVIARVQAYREIKNQIQCARDDQN